jgi:hypothetical protein
MIGLESLGRAYDGMLAKRAKVGDLIRLGGSGCARRRADYAVAMGRGCA